MLNYLIVLYFVFWSLLLSPLLFLPSPYLSLLHYNTLSYPRAWNSLMPRYYFIIQDYLLVEDGLGDTWLYVSNESRRDQP